MYLFVFLSCENDIKEVNKLFDTHILNVEEAHNIEMLYSDSAIVRIKIISPRLLRYIDKKNPVEEFPDGILVEFYGPNKKIQSWLKSDYAIRNEKENKITVRKNVELYNRRNEKIESGELIWNESEGILENDKLVRVTLPEKGDTIWGFGIKVDQDFTQFEVKKKFSANLKMEELAKALEN